MSRNQFYIAAAVALLAIAVGSIMFNIGKAKQGNTTENPPASTHSPRTPTSKPLDPATPTQPGKGQPGTSTEQNPNEAAAEVNRIIKTMHDAAVTYEAAELPKIEPFLLHSNPEVRKAAIDAMITLGDASAGAMMRNAATKAYTPYEAVALLEAAKYVELPSAVIKPRDPSKLKNGPKIHHGPVTPPPPRVKQGE